MSHDVRQQIMSRVKTVVVKIGTAVLSDANGRLDRTVITALASQVSDLVDRGLRVVLVSSGAVGAGMGELGLAQRPKTLPHLQAAAAVGQAHLIQAYDAEFRTRSRRAAQVLLIREDFHDRLRYLNARNTLNAILDFGAIPVINENDTTSVEELELSFTDNDYLAALVTNLLRAQLLVILSNVEGLLDNAAGKPLDVVPSLNAAVKALATSERSSRGRGGMTSKLRAAEIATGSGEAVIIAHGKRPEVLSQILAGQPVGTLFLPAPKKLSSRKRWIGFSARSRGKLHLDAGAAGALRQRGKSLLPSGITRVEGRFNRGDIVSLLDPQGLEIGRGLASYDAQSTTAVIGRKTSEIAAILGSAPYLEIIHHDNLVIFET